MKRVYYRILLTLIAAGFGIGVWVYSDYTMTRFFKSDISILREFQALETDVGAIEGEVLRSSAFLYYNYDKIHAILQRVEKHLTRLKKSHQIQSSRYKAVQKELTEFQSEFQRYGHTIERHLTLNASLKNSVIYLPTLQIKAYDFFDISHQAEQRTLWLISHINAMIFVTKNTLDTDLIDEIKSSRKELEAVSSRLSDDKKVLTETLMLHLDHFFEAYPKYIKVLDTLLHFNIKQRAVSVRLSFQKNAQKELASLNNTSRILLSLYLVSLGIVVMFIFRTQRENKHLHALKNDLERSLIMDALTGLKNREAFRRLRRRRRVSCLILVNIDRFKHINEFYGSEVGDYVLKKIADRLREMIADKTDISVFRLGGDDFGFVYETGRTHWDDEALAAAYHRQLEDFFVETQGVRIDISFTIGISREKDRLFETADMALKYAKRSQRKRYAVYSSEIDQRENIQKNIQMIQKVRDALVHDSVLPYFQPIFDIKRNQTARYEALARIEQEHEQNKVLMPYHFLGAAREAKLSGEITREILRKTFVVAQDCPGNFSVNISAEDIEDQENRNEIFALLAHHRDIADKITFEILESEEIGDYEAMNEFIRSVKRFGCEIAIDDFGSGYSNFEKILKLDIDYIKIDGSLIKKIDYDRHTEWIVRTILEFARHAGFKSVAEFVHSKAVYDKVVELGFDYAQGYFIGKPAREVVTGQHHPVE